MEETNESKIWYLCDGKEPDCSEVSRKICVPCGYQPLKGRGGCRYTPHIEHAKNFSNRSGNYLENYDTQAAPK